MSCSFDSLNLEDYTLDIREVLADYTIHKDIYKQDYSIHEGIMKNSSQQVKIYRRPFPSNPEAKERFKVLMTAFNQGIILADNIFLSYEGQTHYICIVEPSATDQNSKFVQLSQLLKSGISYAKKHRLYQNLLIIVKSLHELGEAHMELCPDNIWIEDEFQVYLRPFNLESIKSRAKRRILKPYTPKNSASSSKYCYSSPEYIQKIFNILEEDSVENSMDSLDSNNDKEFNYFANDMWSLGCIFNEMFITPTALYRDAEPFERMIAYFEMLGIPRKEDVFYMTKELYESIIKQIKSRDYVDQEPPFIRDLLKSLTPEEALPLTTLFSFNPDKRPDCEELTNFPFFRAAVPIDYKSFIISPEDYQTEQSKERSSSPLDPAFLKGYAKPKVAAREEGTHVDSISGMRVKTQSDQNTSSWWNLDLFGEHTLSGPNVYKHDGSKAEAHNPDFASPTFQHKPETATFNKPMRQYLDEENNQDWSQGHFGARDERQNHQNSQRYEESPNRSFNKASVRPPGRNQSLSSFKENLEQCDDRQAFDQNSQHWSRSMISFHKPQKSSLNIDATKIFPSDNPNQSLREIRNLSQSQNQTKHNIIVDIQRQSGSPNASYHSQTPKKTINNDSKVIIGVETLKNLLYEEGEYYCEVRLQTSPFDNSIVSFESDYVTVENRTALFNFKCNINTHLETMEQLSKDDALKILIFYKPYPNHIVNEPLEPMLYGICEISIGPLFANLGKSARNNTPKTLTGWYNVYDTEEAYRTVGQIKTDISLYISELPMSTRHVGPFEEKGSVIIRQPRTSTHYSPYREGQTVVDRRETTEYSCLSLIDREKENEKYTSRSQVAQKRAQEKSAEANKSVFDIIQNDLSQLNIQLKQKEIEYAKDAEMHKKRTADAQDFAIVVERLRQIIEGDEDFGY